MYSMKKINKIREMYFDEGMKIVQIAKRTNISTNTIRKFIKLTDFNMVNKPEISKSKILDYEPYILELLKQERTFHYKQRLTAKRVFELLREKHPDYPCSYYLTRKFFQNKRSEFYSLSKQYIPIKHNPGNAQADFGAFYYNSQGQRIKAYYLTLSFPYSNAFYCQIFKGKSSECMLQGLKSIFNHLGGVPYEITFDNDTGIVRISTDKIIRVLNDLFLKFKNHYNFKTHFCNLHSPNEKANVEKAIHTLRMQVFSPAPEIEDFDSFNEQLLGICDSLNNRNRKGYYKTIISKMLVTDKANLMPLPECDFEVATLKNRRCNEMGCIVIQDKHYYYISPKFIKKKVIVKFTATKICFYDEFNRFLFDCPRLYENSNAVFVNWGEYFQLLSIKTGALTKCNILDCFPETLREFLLDSDIKIRRKYMQIMHEIYIKSDFQTAISVAESMATECEKTGVSS